MTSGIKALFSSDLQDKQAIFYSILLPFQELFTDESEKERAVLGLSPRETSETPDPVQRPPHRPKNLHRQEL